MADVLIFDDDPMLGGLLGQLLDSMGLSSRHYADAADVSNLVQQSGCRLVILDLMMPGMDGLSACRAIRANPATRYVKIAILTAKNFESDRQAGKDMGADLFLNKPFELEDLRKKMEGLLSTPASPEACVPPPPLTVAVRPRATIIDLRDSWIVFDAGAGLGEFSAKRAPPAVCWVIFSRYAPENESELSAVDSLRAAGCAVRLAGPADSQDSLKRLATRTSGPTEDGDARAPIVYPLREGGFHLEPYIRGVCKYTRYPGTAMAYRLDIQGRGVVYCPANEISLDSNVWNEQENARFKEFIRGAQLLIHGFWRSQGQPADGAPEGRRGAWEPVVEIALDARIKRLLLLSYGDVAALEEYGKQAREKIAAKQSSMECAVAKPSVDLLL